MTEKSDISRLNRLRNEYVKSLDTIPISSRIVFSNPGLVSKIIKPVGRELLERILKLSLLEKKVTETGIRISARAVVGAGATIKVVTGTEIIETHAAGTGTTEKDLTETLKRTVPVQPKNTLFGPLKKKRPRRRPSRKMLSGRDH